MNASCRKSSKHESPHAAASLDDTTPRDKGRTLRFLLAAIPAVVPTFGYLATLVYVSANFLGYDCPLPPATGSFMWWIGALSIHATFVQFPIYVLWALFSKNIGWKARIAWAAVLLFLNMVAFPYFLFCKYRRQMWPPAGVRAKRGLSGARWHQFSLCSCLVALMFLGFMLVPTAEMIRRIESLRAIPMSVRLTSFGTVEWYGVQWHGDVIPVSSLRPRLELTQEQLRSPGAKTRLMIECYNDVSDADVTEVKALGRNAGFDIVDIEYLGWPSPDRARLPD